MVTYFWVRLSDTMGTGSVCMFPRVCCCCGGWSMELLVGRIVDRYVPLASCLYETTVFLEFYALAPASTGYRV